MFARAASHRFHEPLLRRRVTLARHPSSTKGTSRMHRTTRRWVTGAAALSAGVLMIGPVTAFAQSDDPSGSTTTTAPSTPSSIPAAPAAPKVLPDWLKGVLDGLVSSGTLTQAQADAVTKALQDARPAMDHGGGRWGGPRGGRLGASLEAAAKALGIDLDALRTELQSGKTLAEVATAHGVDVQQRHRRPHRRRQGQAGRGRHGRSHHAGAGRHPAVRDVDAARGSRERAVPGQGRASPGSPGIGRRAERHRRQHAVDDHAVDHLPRRQLTVRPGRPRGRPGSLATVAAWRRTVESRW